MADLNENLFNEATEQYVESIHKFTQPIRYYKSNDPYYWEVDNIPLKQLEENILFLRDQVANNLSVSGIGRDDIRELRPFVNGTDRFVYVNPGRFTGRVNDAYNKGISMFTRLAALDYKNEGGEQVGVQQTNYRSQAIRETREFKIGADVFKKISGETVGEPLLDNGLYSFLQHHAVSFTNGTFEWTSFNLTGIGSLNQGLGVSGLPKSKAAVWRGTGTNFSTIFSNDLQQEAVEFTRYWGGSSRTAVVDVRDTLSIEVPPFDEEEFANTTEFSPAARIDLLFVYTHPMDVSSTTIMSDLGNTPQTITAPQLGILRGAGVITLDKGLGTYNQTYTGAPGHFDTTEYADASSLPSNYFLSENMLDLSGYKMHSTMADQIQTLVGVNGNYSNIPSPDDLLNLTPLFEGALESTSLALIGQSILPIAYIVSKRGKAVIETEDMMDIRPFLRTTELSYNERAGISAAIPPLSFANPAVGKQELRSTVLEVRDFVQQQLNEPIFISKPVAAGTIYGGIKYGVEGPLLAMYRKRFGSINLNNDDEIRDALLHFKLRGINSNSLPNDPGWDKGKHGITSGRNQWLYSVSKIRNSKFNDYAGLSFGEYVPSVSQMGFADHTSGPAVIFSCLLVKKDISFADLGITMEDTAEYDVQVSMANCQLMTQLPQAKKESTRIATPATWNGISVEKRDDGFTIVVGLGPAAHQTNFPPFGTPASTSYKLEPETLGTASNWVKNNEYYNRVLVTSNDYFENPGNIQLNYPGSAYPKGEIQYPDLGGSAKGSISDINAKAIKTYSPMLVTYPTVNFTVVKYEADSSSSIKGFFNN